MGSLHAPPLGLCVASKVVSGCMFLLIAFRRSLPRGRVVSASWVTMVAHVFVPLIASASFLL